MNSKRGVFLALLITLSFITSFCPPPCAGAGDDWAPLMDRLIADGFDQSVVRMLFQSPDMAFDPIIMTKKIEILVRKKYFQPPVTGPRTTSRVYKGFLRPDVIETARAFIKENAKPLADAQARYKVPKEIIVSIMLVETKLGEYMGERNALNSLASMALCADFEKVRPHMSTELLNEGTEGFAKRRCGQKADWAYNELKALLRYGSDSGYDLTKMRGSVYGAIGLCQFMPSQIYVNGVDGDGDGKIDIFSRADAFHSIANYLKNSGWKAKMSRKRQVKVIYAYNHSTVYANTILAVAERLSDKNTAKRRQPVKPA